MSHLAGTGALVRLILRRDRVRIAVWLVAIPVLVYAQAVSIDGLYPNHAELARAGELVEGNAAFIAMAGPPLALDTLGGRVAFEMSAFAMVLAALMNVFLVTRHVRGDEEAGRTELLRSTVVGRRAAVSAALAVALLIDGVLGLLVFASLLPVDVPLAGSAALALGVSGVGLVFGAVAAVTSQLTVGTRTATGLAGAVLAAAYVLRAAGDVGNGVLTWLSPVGWGQALRPFADERWWAAGPLLAATAALASIAYLVNDHRDVGAGVLHPRPGPPRAGDGLGRPIGLAVRLHRGALIGWTVGLLLGGVAYGSIGGDVEDFVGDNETIADILAQSGGGLVDSFLATTALVLALIASGFAVQAILRLNTEEQAGRAEPLLATAVSRAAWAGSHLRVVAGGTVVVLAAAGLGTGATYGLIVGDAGQVPRLILASVAYAPAVLVVVGLATVVYGIAGRAAVAVWGVVGACFVVDFLGEVLSLPAWIRDVSPFHHVPMLPAVPFDPLPLVLLCAVAASLVALGLVALARRDVAS